MLAHPGIARTALAAHSRAGVVNRVRLITNSPEVGALSILFAATQDLPGNAYVGPRGPGGLKGHPAIGTSGRGGADQQLAAELWGVAADLTGRRTMTHLEVADHEGLFVAEELDDEKADLGSLRSH